MCAEIEIVSSRPFAATIGDHQLSSSLATYVQVPLLQRPHIPTYATRYVCNSQFAVKMQHALFPQSSFARYNIGVLIVQGLAMVVLSWLLQLRVRALQVLLSLPQCSLQAAGALPSFMTLECDNHIQTSRLVLQP